MPPPDPPSGATPTGATLTTPLAGALLFAAAALLLYGFIFWRIAAYERAGIDASLRHQLAALRRTPHADLARDINTSFADDLHRLTFAAIFAANGAILAGDLGALPEPLPTDGTIHPVIVLRRAGHILTREPARAAATHLPDGETLVVGHSATDLTRLRHTLTGGFLLGLAPGAAIALIAAIAARLRMLTRIATLNATMQTIMDGAISARLPTRRRGDALDRLAASANRMLDRIEHLITEVQGVGDDIAHDLRTPLARARAVLDSGRTRAPSQAALITIINRAIADLDQSFATITALLRIRQIQTSARRTSFAEISLSTLVEQAADLYAPLAEDRGQTLHIHAPHGITTHADRDLLFEATANLLDNAIKFAPPGGTIAISLLPGPTLRIADSGPGIPPALHQAALRRFNRLDRLHQPPGTGLGLSLVAAILQLHGFPLSMATINDMFTIDITCHK